jgi:hypothetical protein
MSSTPPHLALSGGTTYNVSLESLVILTTKTYSIYFIELPLNMEGDSNDEGTDDDGEWPSAALDRGKAMEMEIEQYEEHQRFVAEWAITAQSR